MFLWASEFGEVPQTLSSNDSGFRNSVIHKGKIPTKEEVLEYGNKILAIIREKITQLKLSCDDLIRQVVFEYVRDCSNVEESQVSGGTMCVNTIVSLTNDDQKHNSQTLEEALCGVLKWRDVAASSNGITRL